MSNGVGTSDAYFGTVRALKRKPNESEALKILQQMASQVKPIMKKRGWSVGTLREFFPKNPNLLEYLLGSVLLGLNKNYGQEICIRLRPASNDSKFLPYESLLGTLLHELTHIVRGPHDQQFYKLLDELTTECETLMVQGFTGEGFYGAGHRVGQGVSHDLPPHIARVAALEAAEKRRQIGQIMGPANGRKLGG
ncbi:WLM-domain-containing protein, partial [Basidiobolus meristosporus CBS 931.73]